MQKGNLTRDEAITIVGVATKSTKGKMTAQDIIDIIREAGAEDPQSIRDALCDGEGLEKLGIKDDDQEAVEEAYNIMLNA